MNKHPPPPWLLLLAFVASALFAHSHPAVSNDVLSIDELQPGQKGEVWTVFQGTHPEPFSVEVAGVVRNALGPGKSLILCRLTDARVQNMGAVAGMSGSPLYIDGKFVGALSYQVQRFETVRYAGFTPAADLAEVGAKAERALAPAPLAESATPIVSGYQPLQPVFSLSGLNPLVADIFASRLSALGLSVSTLGGYTKPAAATDAAALPATLAPGGAVAVALATGDVTLAGTGTVSRVEGDRITAFGHPMMGLGDVELPMCTSEIVAILPSSLSSFKIANTGRVIATIPQDRLSGVAGRRGPPPAMIPVEVATPGRTLRFQIIRHNQLTPLVTAMGASQAVLASNDAGLSQGFRVNSLVSYPDGQTLRTDLFYSGPQGFVAGLDEFIRRLSTWLQNPLDRVFPEHVRLEVEPLGANPLASLDAVHVSRTRARPGDIVTVTLDYRNYQGAPQREIIDLPASVEWSGKPLDVVVMTGRELDRLCGIGDSVPTAQVRSFDAYLNALRDLRRSDGVYVAVVEHATAFVDQTTPTLDAPGSLERIARGSDEARYARRDVLVPLWESHALPGRLLAASIRRPLRVEE